MSGTGRLLRSASTSGERSGERSAQSEGAGRGRVPRPAGPQTPHTRRVQQPQGDPAGRAGPCTRRRCAGRAGTPAVPRARSRREADSVKELVGAGPAYTAIRSCRTQTEAPGALTPRNERIRRNLLAGLVRYDRQARGLESSLARLVRTWIHQRRMKQAPIQNIATDQTPCHRQPGPACSLST